MREDAEPIAGQVDRLERHDAVPLPLQRGQAGLDAVERRVLVVHVLDRQRRDSLWRVEGLVDAVRDPGELRQHAQVQHGRERGERLRRDVRRGDVLVVRVRGLASVVRRQGDQRSAPRLVELVVRDEQVPQPAPFFNVENREARDAGGIAMLCGRGNGL